MMPSFFGFPAAAPFRSTTWSLRAPSVFQCLAMATGSSEYTEASFILPCFSRTQCPSLMSSAGMISIASVKAWSQAGRDGRWTCSGIPVEEVGEEPEACCIAFFWVELYGENIIPSHGAGKGDTVFGGGSHQGVIPRLREIAVNEIKTTEIVYARPHGARSRLPHLVPAHVGHLEPAPLGVAHRRIRNPADGPRQQGEPLDPALVAALEQHLEPDAYPQERPAACGGQHSRPQAARIHLAHAIRHRALAGEDHSVRLGDLGRIGRDLDARPGANVLHRLGDRAQVAHSVIDDGDAHRGSDGSD